MTYIATFFSHSGAVHFSRWLRKQSMDCRLMPVPRRLSSSCGTCARFDTDGDVQALTLEEEGIEKLFLVEGEEYRLVVDRA